MPIVFRNEISSDGVNAENKSFKFVLDKNLV